MPPTSCTNVERTNVLGQITSETALSSCALKEAEFSQSVLTLTSESGNFLVHVAKVWSNEASAGAWL